ncbi:hypothetical protein LguiB_008372 [Lonicera macranthoides]
MQEVCEILLRENGLWYQLSEVDQILHHLVSYFGLMSGDRLSQVVFISVIQALSKLIVELLVWVSKKIGWVKIK